MSRHSVRPLVAILIAAALALLVKGFVLDLAVVDGRSMLPRYRDGDVVAVLRCAYGLRAPFGLGGARAYLLRWDQPAVGDIVAARSPADGRPVVKRVAVRGPLLLEGRDGHLRGGDLDLELDPGAAAVIGRVVELPPSTVFLLGDNLPESVDSRSYGPVSDEAIVGRVLGGPLFRGERTAKPRRADSGSGREAGALAAACGPRASSTAASGLPGGGGS
jgi:signal peptidase I